MIRAIYSLALISLHIVTAAQTVTLQPLYNSIGVKVQLTGGFDADKTAHCLIQYKKVNETVWKAGFNADRIVIQGDDQFRGSLFLLDENSLYEVQVTLVDSTPVYNNLLLPLQTIATLPSPGFSPTSNVKWVAPYGTGNLYTEAQPGNIKTLLASGAVTCGVTIMVMDGLYTDLNLALTLNADCSDANPILFLAAPGANPVFDGGYSTPLTWTQHASDPRLYSAALPAGTGFTNLCLINGRMMYPYPTLTANLLFGNYNLVDLNLDDDGFVRDDQVIWVKTQAGVDPDTAEVVLSKAFRFLTVYGNDKNAYLKFRGLTIKNIAKSNLSGVDAYTAIAVDLRRVHHVTFDHCTFEFNNSTISFTGICNDILIQNSSVKHQNGSWSHAMVKKSNVFTALVPTSMGRAGETGAVEFSQGKNIVIRNNRFEGINSGVVAYFDTPLMEEVDIYNNVFADNFDAIECDGNWCNLRVWNNEIIRPMAGFSLAPPLLGPRYYYRNVIHHLTGRHNEEDDPYFIGCAPVSNYASQAIGIKTNSGVTTPVESAANLYFINNTFHSDDTLGFAYTLWGSEWKNLYSINNIFYSTRRHVGYFQGFLDKNTFQMHSESDNYFCADASQPLFVIKEIHGQFTCHDIFDVQLIEPQLRSITGSDHIHFLAPHHQDPEFATTDEGGFVLTATSPLIDQGKVVPGFYDYIGNKPDLGAKETAVPVTGLDVLEDKNILLYPNPAGEAITVDFGAPIVQATITVFNITGQQLSRSEITHTRQWRLELPQASGLYLVEVKTGVNTFFYRVIKTN